MTTHDGNEVEIKFRCAMSRLWSTRCESAGFQQKTPSTLETNTLYDTASGELRRAGEVLRLRVYGDRNLLTHKSRGTALKHKSRVEHETGVDSAWRDARHSHRARLSSRPSAMKSSAPNGATAQAKS